MCRCDFRGFKNCNNMHIFLGGFRVRYIYTGEKKDKVVWKETNKGPDSIAPYFIIPDKESDDSSHLLQLKWRLI